MVNVTDQHQRKRDDQYTEVEQRVEVADGETITAQELGLQTIERFKGFEPVVADVVFGGASIENSGSLNNIATVTTYEFGATGGTLGAAGSATYDVTAVGQ